MEKSNDFWIGISASVPFIGTALAGSVLQSLKGRWLGWKNFVLSAASAGFGAWIVLNLVPDVLSQGWGIFASGMIGYSGGSLVDVALAAFTRRTEKVVSGDKEGTN